MEILGVGLSELIFIVIIALIVLGPKDMQKAGKTIGKWMRDIVTSDWWKVFQQTSRELRTLPNKLMREANEDSESVSTGHQNRLLLRRGADSPLEQSPTLAALFCQSRATGSP
jgi:Sec-independent protein translocase protein TatA